MSTPSHRKDPSPFEKKKAKPIPKVKRGRAWVVDDNYPAFDHKLIIYTTIVNGTVVRQGHWSGRFDGPVETLVKHLIWAIKKYNLSFITTTESQQRFAQLRVRRALKRQAGDIGPWDVRKRGEYLCLFSTTTFFEMKAFDPEITQYTKIKGYAGWRNMRSARFVLRLRSESVAMAWWVFHGPSDIQDGNGFGGSPKQVAIAKRGYPALGKDMDDAPDHWVKQAVGDTNGSARDEFFLNFFEGALDATSVWRGNMPRQGTHAQGDRVIDTAFTRETAA